MPKNENEKNKVIDQLEKSTGEVTDNRELTTIHIAGLRTDGKMTEGEIKGILSDPTPSEDLPGKAFGGTEYTRRLATDAIKQISMQNNVLENTVIRETQKSKGPKKSDMKQEGSQEKAEKSDMEEEAPQEAVKKSDMEEER